MLSSTQKPDVSWNSVQERKGRVRGVWIESLNKMHVQHILLCPLHGSENFVTCRENNYSPQTRNAEEKVSFPDLNDTEKFSMSNFLGL